MVNYLVDCFVCFKYAEEGTEPLFAKVNPFSKRSSDEDLDTVKVGSRRDIEDYEIHWRKLSEIEGQKIVLFDSFKPSDIVESQFSLKHSLIVVQTLSDFPWLLKKIITRLESEPGHPQKYTVTLVHNCTVKKIEVDECVPMVKERGEPMFLSNRNEIWPMVLQKAMARLEGSYLALNTLSPLETLETITGFYTKQLPLSNISNSHGLVSALQELSMRGYLFLLQGRPRTELNNGSEVSSFAVLNYYEKGTMRKLLISCPTIIDKWHESKSNVQLAVLKAHYSRHNQSCLWIDESKLEYFFTHVVVSFVKEGYLRNDLRVKVKIKSDQEPNAGNLEKSESLKIPKVS
jgi:hypothetical protein